MNTQLKSLRWIAPAVLYTVTTSQSWAADTVCTLITKPALSYEATATTVTGSTTLPDVEQIDLMIAVASNFYQPAIRFSISYLEDLALSTEYDPEHYIGVCHNATGHLVQEITQTGHPAVITGEWLSEHIGYNYGLFLAANTAAPAGLAAGLKIGSPGTYAKGVPTLYIKAGKTLASILQTPGSGGVEAYYKGTTSVGLKQLNPSYTSPIAIALPSAAPYGVAAQNVLTAMGNWQTFTAVPGNTVTGNCTDTDDDGGAWRQHLRLRQRGLEQGGCRRG